jgi:retinol dehydrogenase 14
MEPSMANTIPMAGKVVLITGGTGGIGKATAIGLALLGARVGITGRDLARAKQAAADIRAASGNAAIDAFAADMSSQAEVRRLAVDVLDAYPKLDVLVNNVGGFWAHRHLTTDGLEHTFAVNYLAPFLLTNLLLDRVKNSAPARVVTVSSGVQATGHIDFDDLQGARNYSGERAYNQSKLAVVMFTNELARRLAGTGVTANSLHPGMVRTNFGAEDQAGWFAIAGRMLLPLLKAPAQGAETSIYLASSPDVEDVTGQFFADRKPKTANKLAYDTNLTARLWQISAGLVGMNTGDPAILAGQGRHK